MSRRSHEGPSWLHVEAMAHRARGSSRWARRKASGSAPAPVRKAAPVPVSRVSLFTGEPFMTGRWGEIHIAAEEIWHLGTPIFFDLGVYLVVIGAVLTIILTLAEGD